MLNYFNDAYPSFGLNPLLSHFSLLVNYLAIVTFILILRIKNYLNKNEMIILIITSSSPFFLIIFYFHGISCMISIDILNIVDI